MGADSYREDASRFARELVTQELGIIALIKRGVRVLTANGDDLTDSSDPSRKMMRQIAGSFAEYEKARLVAKLKAARERKRATSHAHKCEGRKSWAEINPELVREVKRLRRRSPKGHQRSLREVAAELAALGCLNERGVMFSAASGRVDAGWMITSVRVTPSAAMWRLVAGRTKLRPSRLCSADRRRHSAVAVAGGTFSCCR